VVCPKASFTLPFELTRAFQFVLRAVFHRALLVAQTSKFRAERLDGGRCALSPAAKAASHPQLEADHVMVGEAEDVYAGIARDLECGDCEGDLSGC
jgi:hypothetical protein